tara:strand:- start:333 stop:1268 length:936 start_codon:yes stop_codon:yes gene_type:complete
VLYSANNAKLKIDGNEIIASNASISLNASLTPRYDHDQRNTRTYAASNGVGGNLSFSYYLTGTDYFKQFLTGQGEPVGGDSTSSTTFGAPLSGNFGGLNFESGYLTSYSVSFAPNSPVVANATVTFFDDMSKTGSSFSPTETLAPDIGTVLNCRNAYVVTGNDSWRPEEPAGTSPTQNIDNFIGGTYNYAIEVKPVYLMGETVPSAVSYGVQNVNMNFEIDNPTGFLPFSGCDAMISVQMKSQTEDLENAETFTCSGRVNQRSIASAANDYIKHTINITENDISEFNIAPKIGIDNNGDSQPIEPAFPNYF